MSAYTVTDAMLSATKAGGATVLDFQNAWLRRQGMIATSPSWRKFMWPFTVLRNTLVKERK